jgi:ubiquinone/menaquinone biosynthesis C-methylase UbiE
VFYGLINGYDVYGVEPEQWKHQFNLMKAREKGYPPSWTRRYSYGVGENLPFADLFDMISTYQTLEHVQSHKKCFGEFNRVLRGGTYLFSALTIGHFLRGITEFLCFRL